MQGVGSMSASILQIANSSQNYLATIIGGQVVTGSFPISNLQSAQQLNTTDIVQTSTGTAPIRLQIAPASVSGPIQVSQRLKMLIYTCKIPSLPKDMRY